MFRPFPPGRLPGSGQWIALFHFPRALDHEGTGNYNKLLPYKFIIILISSEKKNNSKTKRLEQVFPSVFSCLKFDIRGHALSLCRKMTLQLYTKCWWKAYTEVPVTIPRVPGTFLARFQVCRPSANTENSRRMGEQPLVPRVQ